MAKALTSEMELDLQEGGSELPRGSYSHRHRPNWCYWALHWSWLSPGSEGAGRDTGLQLLPGNLSSRRATTGRSGGKRPGESSGDRQGREKCKYRCPRSVEGQRRDSSCSTGDVQLLQCDTGTRAGGGVCGKGDTGKGETREGTRGAARVPPSPRRSPFPLSQLPSRAQARRDGAGSPSPERAAPSPPCPEPPARG